MADNTVLSLRAFDNIPQKSSMPNSIAENLISTAEHASNFCLFVWQHCIGKSL